MLTKKNLTMAVQVIHSKVQQQIMSELDADFFNQAATNETTFADLNSFKIVIKALCKTKMQHDFEEVKLLHQKM